MQKYYNIKKTQKFKPYAISFNKFELLNNMFALHKHVYAPY